MFKLGLSTCGKKEMNEEFFAACKKAGISAVEISVSNKDGYNCVNIESAKALADKYGIELWSFHLPFCPFAELDLSKPELSDGAVAYQSAIIKRVSTFGIKRFIIHPSGERISDEEKPLRISTAKKALKALAETAKECGAVLAVEDLPRLCLGKNSDEILELISADDSLRVCLDTNHLLNEDLTHFIDAVGDKIITTHISDYDFVDERHWLPGEGNVDWNAVIDALKKVNYNGVWLYEVSFKCPESLVPPRKRDLTCEDFAQNAKKLFEGK